MILFENQIINNINSKRKLKISILYAFKLYLIFE